VRDRGEQLPRVPRRHQARRLGVNGHVTGAPTAAYYWPTAILREFATVFISYKVVNFGICALIVALPLAYAAFRGIV
jgi:hypothetical protein